MFKKHLKCVPPDYKMGETYKDKNHKVIVSYVSSLLIIIIGAGKK